MKAKIIGIVILSLVVLIGLDFGFGYLGVFKTKTVGKTRQNAEREVFEQTQSYVEAKRQEAIKLYAEYNRSSEDEKKTLEFVIRNKFANFNEQKYINEPELRIWIYNIKLGKTQ
jgi:hypothetical protein